MTDLDDGAWFAAKRFGYGAGLPIAWQGWVLMAVQIGVPLGLIVGLGPRHTGYLAAAVTVVVLAPLPLIAKKTRGGWKWRNGGD